MPDHKSNIQEKQRFEYRLVNIFGFISFNIMFWVLTKRLIENTHDICLV